MLHLTKASRLIDEEIGERHFKMVSHKSQPTIAQLQEIVNLLDVDVRELLKS